MFFEATKQKGQEVTMLVALSIVVSVLSAFYFLLRLIGEGVTNGKQVLGIDEFSSLIIKLLAEGRPDRAVRLCATIDTPLTVFAKSLILAKERPDGVFGDVSLANETVALHHAEVQLRATQIQTIGVVVTTLVFVAVCAVILWMDGGQTGWVVAPITLATIANLVFVGLLVVVHQGRVKFFKGMPSHLARVRHGVDEGFSRRGGEPSIPSLSFTSDPRARVTESARRNSG